MKTSVITKTFALACLIFCALSAHADPTPAPANTNHWTGLVSAGVTLTRGNSETTLASLTAAADHKTDKNEWSLGANATYGQAQVTVDGAKIDTTTAQSAGAFVQYNHMFTDRFYCYGRVEGYHDDLADIHYRVTVSPGLGYYLIKDTNMDLCAELGPGFVSQSLGSEEENFATVRAAEKFHWRLSDRARLWETAEIDPDLGNISNYIITSEIGVEADLNAKKNLSLQCYLDDNYNSKPAPNHVQNDLKLFVAIAYKF
jgi:putative salt-induced outer membrane protein YdiY